MDDDVREHYALDGIVTLVDAHHLGQQLGHGRECAEQIAFADLLVLNKTDLVDPAAPTALETRLRGMNAPVIDHAWSAQHTHDDSVTSVGLEVPGDLDPERLNQWLSALLREQGPDIFRMKERFLDSLTRHSGCAVGIAAASVADSGGDSGVATGSVPEYQQSGQ